MSIRLRIGRDMRVCAGRLRLSARVAQAYRKDEDEGVVPGRQSLASDTRGQNWNAAPPSREHGSECM